MRDFDYLIFQYAELVGKAVEAQRPAFEEFDFKPDKLGVSLVGHLGPVGSLSKLWDLVRILLLSYEQLSIERGYSRPIYR